MARTSRGPKPGPKRKEPSSGGSKGTAEAGSEASKKQKQSDNSTNMSKMSPRIPGTVELGDESQGKISHIDDDHSSIQKGSTATTPNSGVKLAGESFNNLAKKVEPKDNLEMAAKHVIASDVFANVSELNLFILFGNPIPHILLSISSYLKLGPI